jgi:hypothetical protein
MEIASALRASQRQGFVVIAGDCVVAVLLAMFSTPNFMRRFFCVYNPLMSEGWIKKYISPRISRLGFFGSGKAGMRILFPVQICVKRGTFFAGLKDRYVISTLHLIKDFLSLRIKNDDSMAACDDNLLTRGNRGRIGNLIFRHWGRKTVVSSVPDYTNRKWSSAQKANRLRFRDAMAYARTALNDPEKLKFYRKKAKGMQTVWNVAVADYMKKPQIEDIEAHK